MSKYTASNAKNQAALDFDTQIVDLGIPGVLDILGMSSWMAHEGIQSTPFKNMDAFIDGKVDLATLLVGMANKMVDLEQDRVSLSFGTYDFLGSDLVNGVLTFSSLGISRPPLNAGQFLVFKGGTPISSGDPFRRTTNDPLQNNVADALLIPGTGIRFVEAWASDQVGVLWTFTGRTGEMIKSYSYFASSFEGAGNREIFLAQLGTDLNGQTMNPLPALASQIKVFDGTLKTEEGLSYVTSGFGGAAPKITLSYDAFDDQVFHFMVVR